MVGGEGLPKVAQACFISHGAQEMVTTGDLTLALEGSVLCNCLAVLNIHTAYVLDSCAFLTHADTGPEGSSWPAPRIKTLCSGTFCAFMIWTTAALRYLDQPSSGALLICLVASFVLLLLRYIFNKNNDSALTSLA